MINNMKTTIGTALAIMLAGFIISACGNAAANKKKKERSKAPAVIELTTEAFNTNVYDLKSDKPVYLGDKPAVIDFNATWCGPCRRIAPILDELAKEYEGKIVIYKVDVDKNREVAEAFGISSIPAILYIPLNSEPVMTVGLRSKGKMVEEIDRLLFAK
jgi:thioredoxin